MFFIGAKLCASHRSSSQTVSEPKALRKRRHFEGYEDIHKMCMEAPKYGNDNERAAWIVGEVFTYSLDRWHRRHRRQRAHRSAQVRQPYSPPRCTQLNTKLEPAILAGKAGIPHDASVEDSVYAGRVSRAVQRGRPGDSAVRSEASREVQDEIIGRTLI